jgi:hypothetical protein
MQLIHSKTWNCNRQPSKQRPPRLTSVAVDPQRRLLAVVGQQLQRFSADGELEAQFSLPEPAWSIAVGDESVWVGMRGAVAQFDLQGNLLETIADRDRLGRITGLAVLGATLLAADATHHTIHLYHHKKWQRELGRDVNTRGFMIPNGLLDLALDVQRETVLVAHPQKHRVERYRFDGELTAKFGRFGMHDPADFGGCCNPTNITTTADGLIAVSEKAPPRVKLFTADGKFLAQSTSDVFDPGAKNIDLAVDTRGRLYATDQVRCAIEVFQLEPAGD